MKLNMKNLFPKAQGALKKVTAVMLCLVLVGLCLSTVGCDKNKDVTIPICKDIIFSECKTASKNNEIANDVQITYNDKSLNITHNDIYLNCGFKKIDVTMSINGDTIEVNVEESPLDANCTCPVDISYSIGEFEIGTYTLIIKHYNQQIHIQTIKF